MVTAGMKSEDVCFLAGKLDKPSSVFQFCAVLKSRVYSAENIHIVKAMVFPVWLWELDHKEGGGPKNWCLCIVVLRKLPRVPWTARRLNHSILREINPEYSLEGLMLKLKLQYLVIWCEHLTDWKSPWCWERLRAGEKGIRGWDGWMTSPMQWTWPWANFRRWWGTERPGVLHFMGSQRAGHDWETEHQW